jgi:anti-sigma regulatory factor (Ser/Thr protein kinase)
MDIPAGSGQQSARSRRGSGDSGSSVLGSLTVPGSPRYVSNTRAFITRTLSGLPGIDSDAATLLTSELVTNAIQHTKSGDGGEVVVDVTGLPDGVLVEVTDQGSCGTPEVKSDLYAAEGHGLYLVQRLAGRWGVLRDWAGTTVWFHLPATGQRGACDEDEPTTETGGAPPRQRLRPVLR